MRVTRVHRTICTADAVAPPHAPRTTCSAQPPQPRARRRLDDVCVDLRPDLSKNVLQSFIVQGKVRVNGTPQTKAGFQVGPQLRQQPGTPHTQVHPSAVVEILAELPKYVCRAGHKLEAALDAFDVDPTGWVCLDAGLSTGGFADCLLQRDAAVVYGVDVGYGQVAERIRNDPRVVVMERTNVRHMTAEQMPPLPGSEAAPRVDLVTLDLSFISVLKVLPAVMTVMQPQAQLIVLIKPQFEVRLEFFCVVVLLLASSAPTTGRA